MSTSSPSGVMSSRHKYALVVILLFAAAVFAPYVGDYFWLDDVAWIKGAEQAPSLLQWTVVPGDTFPYRPLAAGGFAILGQACGCTPWPYRALALGLHLVNVALTFALGRRVLGDNRAALAGAALWAIYPVHRWAVLWIADLAGVAAATFALACLLAFHRYVFEPGRRRWLALSLAFFVLAVLAKETYLAVALLVPLLHVLHDRPSAALSPSPVRSALPFFLLAALLAIPVAASYVIRPGEGGVDLFSSRYPAGLARAMLFMLLPVINPNTINEFGTSLRENLTVIALAAPIALVWLALLWRTRSQRAWLLSLWAPLSLLPVLITPFFLLPYKGRYLYFPSVGFCLLLGLLWRKGEDALRRRARSGLVAYLPVALLALAVAGLGFHNVQQQWWVRVPERPAQLLHRYIWSSLLGCPFTPDEIRAEMTREGTANVSRAVEVPLFDTTHRYYMISVALRALARELAGDIAGARSDALAARALALRGDLDTRDKESAYLVPQARVLEYLDAQLGRLDAGGP